MYVYICVYIHKPRDYIIDWPLLYWIQWINTASKLQVSTGIFYPVDFEDYLKKELFWKRHHVNHPILSEPFFPHISVTTLCNSLCSLCLTSLCICFYSGDSSQRLIRLLFLFFVFFPLSLLLLCMFHYLSHLLLQGVLVPKVGIASPKHSASHKTCIDV